MWLTVWITALKTLFNLIKKLQRKSALIHNTIFFLSFLSVFICWHIKIIWKILLSDYVITLYFIIHGSSFLFISWLLAKDLTHTQTYTLLCIICIFLCRHLKLHKMYSALSFASSCQLPFLKMRSVLLFKLYSFSIHQFIIIFLHTDTQDMFNRVVDETTWGIWFGGKMTMGEWCWGTKWLRVKNICQMTFNYLMTFSS